MHRANAALVKEDEIHLGNKIGIEGRQIVICYSKATAAGATYDIDHDPFAGFSGKADCKGDGNRCGLVIGKVVTRHGKSDAGQCAKVTGSRTQAVQRY